VTALESDLNMAIASAFYAQDSRLTTVPPVVTLDYGGQVRIEMAFYNSFLNRNSQVITQVWLSVADGRIAVDERPGTRKVSGGLVSDQSVRAGLTLAEDGITRALTALAGSSPGAYRLYSLAVYPGYIRAIFAEEAPAG
jgi:hypothetical protein